MRILISTNFHLDPRVGGTADIVAKTGVKLAESGLDVRLLTGQRRRYPPPGPVTSFADIAHADLVHNFGIWVPFSHGLALTARCLRKPRVWATMGALAPWALSHRGGKKQLALWLYQRRDLDTAVAVQATSWNELQNLRDLGIRAPIALIPHGVDAPDEHELVREPREPARTRTMLLLSRIHPVKGLLNLVEAWARVRPEGWRVVIAGPDERGHRAELEATMEAHGVRPSFTFVGPVAAEEKTQLYKTADLFALPSHTENFGLVVAEALSYGVPVLTTRGTPWKELADTDSGWWIEVGVEPLALALKSILSLGDERLQKMGRNGRRLVAECYGWPAVVAKHIELYRWIGGEAPKPSFVHS